MHTVKLYTQDGQDFIVSGRIPPFTTGNPSVLIWGQRFFLRDPNDDSRYIEAFTVALVDVDLPDDQKGGSI